MNRLPINWRRLALFAGGIFLLVLVVDFNARLEALARLNRQADLVRTEATQVVSTKIALETQVGNATSDQVTEEHARGEGHMIQDGDQAFIVVGEDGPALDIPTEPTFVPTPKPNWQLWWDVFFGE